MRTLIHERVEAARAGTNPTVMCRMPSGWAVLGDVQGFRGYSLLLPDPVVVDLNALDASARVQFLSDMTVIGDALLDVTDAYRINYDILGNTDAALHAHIFPRYSDEPDEYRPRPVWVSPQRNAEPFDVARDKSLMDANAAAIERQR